MRRSPLARIGAPVAALITVLAALVAPRLVQAQSPCAASIAIPAAGTSSTLCLTSPAGSAKSFTVQTVVDLGLLNPATTLTTPTAAGASATADSWVLLTTTSLPELVLKTNTSWAVTIGTSATVWTRDGAPSTKPVGDLAWTSSSGLAGTLGAAAAFASGSARGDDVATRPRVTEYAVTHRYSTDVPGSYSVPITFTVTAP